MQPLKITNTFYATEKTDTRLKYSVTVPDDEEVEFNPITNWGFQENFRKTLDQSLKNSSRILETKNLDTKRLIKIKK